MLSFQITASTSKQALSDYPEIGLRKCREIQLQAIGDVRYGLHTLDPSFGIVPVPVRKTSDLVLWANTENQDVIVTIFRN